MNYILHYEICALIFIIPFIVVISSRKQIKNAQNRTFALLAYLCTASLVLDITTVLQLRNHAVFSKESIYAINISFHILQSFTTFIFLIYILILCHRLGKLRRYVLSLLIVPFLINASLILTTPFSHLIFYIDDTKQYILGDAHFAAYASSIFYFLLSIYIIVKYRKSFFEKNLITALFSILVIVAAQVFQFLQPSYLVILPAAALSVMLMFISLQSPDYYIDANTGLFNEHTIKEFLITYFEKKKKFNLLIFYIDNYNNVMNMLGDTTTKTLRQRIGDYLKKTYRENKIVVLPQGRFAVFYEKEIKNEIDLAAIRGGFPTEWSVGGIEVKVTVSLSCFRSIDYLYYENLLKNIHMTSALLIQKSNGVLLVDEKINDNLNHNYKVEKILQRAIENANIDVHFQPVFNSKKNKFVGLEALARLYDTQLGFIPPSLFIRIAERNGSIVKLGEIILEKVCMFLSTNNIEAYGIEWVAMNLSVTQCMQASLYKQVTGIIDKYNVPYNLISFEVTETAASTSFSTLSQNMQDLRKKGISFSLDDYGTGYSNINYLMNLPFSYIKIDKELLWAAVSSKRSEVLFECLLYMAEKLELTLIAEGAESQSHLDFLRDKKVDLIQGFYYSKPLKPVELMNFFIKMKR